MTKVRFDDGKFKNTVRIDEGILIGYNKQNEEFVLHPIGEQSFQRTIDDLFTAVKHITDSYFHLLRDMNKKDLEKVREMVYTRLVQSASFTIDDLFPDMKEKAFGDGVTDEAILKAQEEIINARSNKQRKSTLS